MLQPSPDGEITCSACRSRSTACARRSAIPARARASTQRNLREADSTSRQTARRARSTLTGLLAMNVQLLNETRLQLTSGRDLPGDPAPGAPHLRDFPAAIGAGSTRSRPIRPNSSSELTEAGLLGVADPGGIRRLRPAAARRRGDPRGDQRLRLQRRRVPRADVHHGHAAAARQRGAEARYLPGIAAGRVAAAGLRRHRADHRLRHDQAEDPRPSGNGDHYVVSGQKVWTSRALHSDLMLLLARTTPLERGEEAQRRAVGVPGRHARGARARARDPADRGDDQPQHHRGVLRQSRRCRPRT